MKNFFPILTLFVNGANGRDKQPKIKRHSAVARPFSSSPNVLAARRVPCGEDSGMTSYFKKNGKPSLFPRRSRGVRFTKNNPRACGGFSACSKRLVFSGLFRLTVAATSLIRHCTLALTPAAYGPYGTSNFLRPRYRAY